MPIYTYLCKKCSQKSDFLFGINQEKTALKCPGCGSQDLEKVFAPFRVVSSPNEGSLGKCSSCSGGNCSSCA